MRLYISFSFSLTGGKTAQNIVLLLTIMVLFTEWPKDNKVLTVSTL
jgi:hypothetical protein